MPPKKDESKKRIETKDDVKEIADGIKNETIKTGKVLRYADYLDRLKEDK